MNKICLATLIAMTLISGSFYDKLGTRKLAARQNFTPHEQAPDVRVSDALERQLAAIHALPSSAVRSIK